MTTGNQGTTLDQRETFSPIASDTLKGTSVYRSNGERVGEIDQVIMDKLTGKVAYAVIFFAFPEHYSVAAWLMAFVRSLVRTALVGEDLYPLPWSLLTYNPALEGYEITVSEQQIKGAPKYSRRQGWDWSDPARGKQVYDYYGVAP